MDTAITMKIDVSLELKEQFQSFFKLKKIDREYFLDKSMGEGEGMRFLEFPGKMEFYHFKKARFHQPVIMNTVNPADSKWFLIHINLSRRKQNKIVQGKTLESHKFLPIGILLYGVGLEITTRIPANIESEIVSIRFHQTLLDSYFDSWRELFDTNKNILYEDLDPMLENKLAQALSSMDNMMDCHSKVLSFMSGLFEKFTEHQKGSSSEKLCSKDINNLFFASSYLRNPLAVNSPSLDELAFTANMGVTKFKRSFKKLFGSAPIQYRNKIRMEFARTEILFNKKTPTELSYMLGYSHPSNFTVAYKQHFGELPSNKR